MNGKQMLIGLSYIDQKFIEEAGQESLLAVTQKPVRSRPSVRKAVLIAAVVSLLLLLAGCVAVFLGLQERKIGELDFTRKFDSYGSPLETPSGDLALATMAGLEGTPAWQASKEWFEFTRNYEPENLTNDPDLPHIPNNYEYVYSCYDQTMVDKLNEIAQTYDMEILGERAVAQRWQREAAFEALGISGLVREGAKADYHYGTCQTIQPHNFRADVMLTLSEEGEWPEEVYATVYYLQNGYLSPDEVFTYDPQGDQWQYRTAGGSGVLLTLSDTSGLIVCQREDAVLVVHLELYWQGVFLEEGTALPTRNTMELLADCFDFTIQTKPIENGLQKKLDAILNPSASAGPPVQEEAYHSYGAYIQQIQYPEFLEYVLYDLNGDGQEELLISRGDGSFSGAKTILNGKVEHFEGLNMEGITLLQNDLILVEGETIVNAYKFVKSMTPTADGVKTANVCQVLHEDGVWTLNRKETTEEEALAAIAQYKPLELNWRPLAEFPMEDGRTFGDLLKEEYQPAGQELLRFYASHCPANSMWSSEYQFFALQDLNSDGVEDLLVSKDGDYISEVYTVKRGQLAICGGSFYLCRDNVELRVDDWEDITTGKCRRYQFGRQEADQFVFWETYLHNEQTGIWYDEISRELPEGVNPLEKFPRENLKMRPIRELLSQG